jgi:hypothetical protein
MTIWKCPQCERSNAAGRQTCIECETDRPGGLPRSSEGAPTQGPAYRVLGPPPPPPKEEPCGWPGCTLTAEEHRIEALRAVKALELPKLGQTIAAERTAAEPFVGHGGRTYERDPMGVGSGSLRSMASTVPHCRMCGGELVGKVDGVCSTKCEGFMRRIEAQRRGQWVRR